jgi:alpha-1,4-galacturonosyltransferase
MATPKRLPYTTTGAGGGARRGSGTVPPVVVLVFLFVVAPSIFLVARSGGNGHVHVASGPSRPTP